MEKKKIKKLSATKKSKILIGWYEWCSLPKLNLPLIKAKIDTGAKTSALHAFNIATFNHNRKKYARFYIHPIQANNRIAVKCSALIVDHRSIMSSNGHKENRYVISTPLILGGKEWDIEITLSNRDPLKFRMLLGREALKDYTIIDPSHSACTGKISNKIIHEMYDE